MYIIYHSRDLDGFTSGAIAAMAVRDNNREPILIGYDYDEPFPWGFIEPNQPVVMLDVSLPMADMYRLARHSKNKFTWIDHHKTSINDFANFKSQEYDHIEAILEDGVAACEIAWKYFFPDRTMPEAISLLGQYDTWRNEKTNFWQTDILPFQYGMRVHCSSPETFPYSILRDNEFVRDVVREGHAILKYQGMVDEFVAKSAFEIDFHGYRAICINGAAFNSNAFKSVYNEAKHDLMIPFRVTKSECKMSIYTTKDIDCSALSKIYSGGGHRQASGNSLTLLQVNELFFR
jgi:oligoribonuclease NrnB/cAMP/cGMP phosphodiesterase (DHH superfamily)